MLTFILLGFFALMGIGALAVVLAGGNGPRSGKNGVNPMAGGRPIR